MTAYRTTWTDNFLIRLFLKLTDLDFTGAAWFVGCGKIMGKRIQEPGIACFLDKTGFSGMNSMSITQLPITRYILKVATPAGIAEIEVAQGIYESKKINDSILVDMRLSRFYENRVDLRPVFEE